MPISSDYKFPKEFGKIYEEMFKHPKSSDEALKLFLKSIKYDFALLKLEKPIKREKYPLLSLTSGKNKNKSKFAVMGMTIRWPTQIP